MTNRTCSDHARGNQRPLRWLVAAGTLARAALFAAIIAPPAPAADPALADQAVRIEAQNQSLQGLAADIERRSGIQIVIPTSMAGQRISAEVQARDWPAALLSLFRRHSTILAWSPDGRLHRLYLLPTGSDARDEPPATTLPGEQNSPFAGGEMAPPEGTQGESPFARALRKANRRVEGDEQGGASYDERSIESEEESDGESEQVRTLLDALRRAPSADGSEQGEEGFPAFSSDSD